MRSPCVSFLTQTPGYARYELIAEAAHCARSTVAEALKALENAGVLPGSTGPNGCARACPDLLGDKWVALASAEDI